jgi:hypothetical protein
MDVKVRNQWLNTSIYTSGLASGTVGTSLESEAELCPAMSLTRVRVIGITSLPLYSGT